MAQVAVMSPDGSVKKIDRDSKEGLQALRKLSALMLKVALKQEFKGIRLGKQSLTKMVSMLIQTRTTNKFLLTNYQHLKMLSREWQRTMQKFNLSKYLLKML